MNNSKRIQAIIDMCPAHEVWADIGADHGFTAAGLISSKKAGHVIATDISEISIAKAAALFAEKGLQTAETRVGNGFSPIAFGEAQGAVISGMGAPLMIGILSADEAMTRSFSDLVLSPNNYPERLRYYLSTSGYTISRERVTEDRGKFYIIMHVFPGADEPLSAYELAIGKNTVKDAEFFHYVQRKTALLEGIVKSSGGKNTEAAGLLEAFKQAAEK